MPEWQQIRLAVDNGADSSRTLAAQFGVTVATVNDSLKKMPDGEKVRSQMQSNYRYIMYDGEVKTAAGWARTEGINVSSKLITQRLRNGWSVEEALTRPSQSARGRSSKSMTSEATDLLLTYADRFHDDPVPEELATFVALLMLEGVGVRPISVIVKRPDYIVQGWAAIGGYISPYIADHHQKIRDALNDGATNIKQIATATGISRERLRQLIASMPDRTEVNARLLEHGVKPVSTAAKAETRHMTEAEITKLRELASMGRSVRGNSGQQVRKAADARDVFTRKLRESGVSREELAEVCGVRPDTIADWLSPANSYRRTLQARAAKRRTRKR